ncbi:P-loop containing nucleoside triphosphate hydrolase protein, partial [Collybia nuda]
QDFSSIYLSVKTSTGKLPWAEPTPLPTYTKLVGNTLYGRQYLSVTIDEAQAFRNVGTKNSAALMLLRNAVFRQIMTGTPLQTSTRDIASMGRLVGISHFYSEEALAEEKADAGVIRRSRGDEPIDGPIEVDQDVVAIVQRLQRQFERRILRRTKESLDWTGKILIPLPPYEEIMMVLKLTTREMEIVSELADKVKESVSSSNGLLTIVSRSFYIEHRMAMGFARTDLTVPPPIFKTLEEWEKVKSTKIDTCARLCKYLLSRDDAPQPTVENGQIHFPELPPLQPGQVVTNTLRILVFSIFINCIQILSLYGIQYLYIDGQTSYGQRAKIVKKFCEDPEYRVLIISAVGSTGLNLTVASRLIFTVGRRSGVCFVILTPFLGSALERSGSVSDSRKSTPTTPDENSLLLSSPCG